MALRSDLFMALGEQINVLCCFRLFILSFLGDEFDDSDAYLHEELLSLLDAGLRSDSGPGAAIIDHENIYTSADGYEYLISRDIARRRTEQGTDLIIIIQ